MHVLARHGLHDLDDELVNAYGQITLIGNGRPSFSAKYTDLGGSANSLLPTAEGAGRGPPPSSSAAGSGRAPRPTSSPRSSPRSPSRA